MKNLPRTDTGEEIGREAEEAQKVHNPFELQPDQRWYVVQARVNREASSRLHLEVQGFRVFLPRIQRTVKHARQHRSVMRAVFPGYLFVALNVERDRWRSINGTVGVARIIMGDNGPIAVPKGIVESLVASLDEHGWVHLEGGLVQGQSVRITNGPFVNLLGRLSSLDDKGRARVLLEIMGGEVIATLERSALEAN